MVDMVMWEMKLYKSINSTILLLWEKEHNFYVSEYVCLNIIIQVKRKFWKKNVGGEVNKEKRGETPNQNDNAIYSFMSITLCPLLTSFQLWSFFAMFSTYQISSCLPPLHLPFMLSGTHFLWNSVHVSPLLLSQNLIIWYLFFTPWLVSFNIMLSRSIHAVAKGRSIFFLSAV